MKITIIGSAGGIGQALALLLKTHLKADSLNSIELWLHDIEEKNFGVAEDLSHIPSRLPIFCSAGSDLSKAMLQSDLVVISAGKPRMAGMERSELLRGNCQILASILKAVVVYCPQAMLAIITNPINSIIPFAAAFLDHYGIFDYRRLFGITTLDHLRAQHFAGQRIQVIGGHCQKTMLPLLSQVNNSELDSVNIRQQLSLAGNRVVELKNGSGSATLSMAQAAYCFIANLLKAREGEMVVETAMIYHPFSKTPNLSRPFVLYRQGIHTFVPWGELSAQEAQELEQIELILQQDCRAGQELAKEILTSKDAHASHSQKVLRT